MKRSEIAFFLLAGCVGVLWVIAVDVGVRWMLGR
jgi:hypothetical protein